MSGPELNKISAAILLAGVIAMSAAILSEIFYHGGGHHEEEKRGYFVEVMEEDAAGGGEKAPELSLPELLAAASVESGEKLAKKCAACHTFEQGGANKVGPNLWNIVNAHKAHISGFAYSQAMMDAGGNWDYEALYHFLEKPSGYIKGTKMAFAGLKKPEQRADMIAYLRSLSDSPASLPEVVAKTVEDTAASEIVEEQH